MISIRQLSHWYERARAGQLAPIATGGSPRPYACPDCGFSSLDPEVTFAHLHTHPQADRRHGERRHA